MMKLAVYSIVLAISLPVFAAPQASKSFTLQNGNDAVALNQKFATLTPGSACTSGEDACVQQKFAQCVGGKFVLQACAPGTICAALPLVNSAGTSVTCTTQSDLDARIAATGASAGGAAPPAAAPPAAASGGKSDNGAAASPAAAAGGDLQTSLSLDPSLVQKGFASDGQQVPETGQVPSVTSTNNFINFCATVKKPLTNGQQVKGGSCNAAPMGVIAATTNMPSSKFTNPQNLATLKANTPFTISMAINNLVTGNFVNAQSNYYSAPQNVDNNGNIIGHTHVVVEKLDSITTTKVTDPTRFAFFKGVNGAAVNGVVTADVTNGLPEGAYRLASINAAANHQPVLVAVAQHGSLDDMIYFTVTADGKPAPGDPAAAAAAAPASNATAPNPAPGKPKGSSGKRTVLREV